MLILLISVYLCFKNAYGKFTKLDLLRQLFIFVPMVFLLPVRFQHPENLRLMPDPVLRLIHLTQHKSPFRPPSIHKDIAYCFVNDCNLNVLLMSKVRSLGGLQ